MRIRALRLFARLGLFAMIWASVSGCFLRQVIGNVQALSDAPPGSYYVIAAISARADVGRCFSTGEPNHKHIICNYVVDGEVISSTTELESAFGLYGVLIDPLILEVPSDVISVTATYDTGSGPQPLPVGQAGSFPVNPSTRITAEVGMTFLFLDLPGDVVAGLPGNPDQGSDLSFSLSYHRLVPNGPTPPTTIKLMAAGLVVVQHQKYYIPLLPCVTDFADVPAITIPESDTPQHLEMALGDLIRNHDANPCDHVLHDFSAAVPPPGLVFAPLVQR